MEVNSLYRNYLIENTGIYNDTKIFREDDGVVGFGEFLKDKIDKVNDRQIVSDDLTNGLISGEVTDLHEVMVATEEARLSLELAIQIRNKTIDAYKEITNMQL